MTNAKTIALVAAIAALVAAITVLIAGNIGNIDLEVLSDSEADYRDPRIIVATAQRRIENYMDVCYDSYGSNRAMQGYASRQPCYKILLDWERHVVDARERRFSSDQAYR